MTGEGTGEGIQTGTPTGQPQPTNQPPAWAAQLPTDLKGNEIFTKYPTVGDLGKAHLEILGKVKELDGQVAKVTELEGKLQNAVPKLPPNPTKEQVEAFYTAIGRPAKPEEYEFPKDNGAEHSPEMVSWAQKKFFEAGLSKEQGAFLAKEWDAFIHGMVEAEEANTVKMKEETEKTFRSQFKSDDEYKAGYELAKRFWKKVTNTDFDKAYSEVDAWQVPLFMQFIFAAAKLTGEDSAPPNAQTGTSETSPGMLYNKTPQHMRK